MEKFVSLRNRIQEQDHLAHDSNGGDDINILDVQSLSYDIAGHADDGDYPEYIQSLTPVDTSSCETPLP